jgi:predicted double-glycine peptidase
VEALRRSNLLLEAISNTGIVGLAVPYEQQSTNCSCGAASLLATLRYLKVEIADKDRDLFKPLGTNCVDGTDSKQIVQLAKRLGLSAKISNGTSLGDLRSMLDASIAPILNFQAWPVRKTRPLTDRKDGHYAVLIALQNNRAYFMDPSISGGKMGWLPVAELERAWLDMETAGQVSRRAIVIRGKTNLGRRKITNPVRIETGR